MATDLLSGLGAEVFGALTGGAREALPFIIGGVSQGLSANSIQSALQAGGIGIRRSNLLTLVNAYRGIFQVAQVQAGLPPEEILPSSIFLPSATFMKNTFAYVISATVQSNVTGLLSTRHITISTPNALSNDQIADYAEDIIANSTNHYHETYQSHSVEEVLVDPRYIA